MTRRNKCIPKIKSIFLILPLTYILQNYSTKLSEQKTNKTSFVSNCTEPKEHSTNPGSSNQSQSCTKD